MIQGTLKNLLLDSTLCSNSLEILVFLKSHIMLRQMVTMELNPLLDIIKKIGLYNSYECLLSKVTGKSDSQSLQKITVLRELM